MEKNNSILIKKIGDLRGLRKSLGKTLEAVAADTGLSVALLSKLETGGVSMSLHASKVLSDYYGVILKPVKRVATYVSYDIKNPTVVELRTEVAQLKRLLKKKDKLLRQEQKAKEKAINCLSRVNKYLSLEEKI